MPWMLVIGMMFWLESLIETFDCNSVDVAGIGNGGNYEDEYRDRQNSDSGVLYSHEDGNGVIKKQSTERD